MPDPRLKYVQSAPPTQLPVVDKYVQKPLTKEQARGFSNTGAFEGDSQYDKYLVYGVDQDKARARTQPWYDELGNTAAKLVPGIALGITENAGYIGELFSPDQDYTNALTEFATKHRQALDEAMPAYRENPEKIFDWKDSAWWMQHGGGLVESIGEFFVTGAGVGGTFGKGAELLSNALKAGATTSKVLTGVAQLGTAATLSYTEGAMSGAQIYKEVYDNELSLHGDSELANKKASDAASHVVKLNTLINTGLNMTSIIPLFKTFNNLKGFNGLARNQGEKLTSYITRLSEMEASGIPQASLKKTLALEALQEGLEEDVNLFAEHEGRIKGGLEKPSDPNAFLRFVERSFTEEGALNFMLGAIGGIGQTVGLDLIPYRNYTKDGETIKVSNHKLNELQQNEVLNRYITTLKGDIQYLTSKQQQLNAAVASGNKVAADQAKNDIFNISALKSIREGTSDAFVEEMHQIAAIDNSTIGEDGKTEAMRQGFADSTIDNDYKTKATKKATDIKSLTNEYEALRNVFQDKFVTDEVFRKRLDVYSKEELTNELSQNVVKFTGDVLKQATNPQSTLLLEGRSTLNALNLAIQSLQQNNDLNNKYTKAVLQNLINAHKIEQVVYDQTASSIPNAEQELKDNNGVVTQLTLAKAPLVLAQEQLRQEKRSYNDLVANKDETTNNLLKVKNKVVEELKKDQQVQQVAKEKKQEQTNLTEAQVNKQATVNEKVGNHIIKTSPNGGFDVVNSKGETVDNKPSIDEAKTSAQSLARKEIKKAAQAKAQPVENVVPDNVSTPKQDEGYQGKTEVQSKVEQTLLNKDVLKNNPPDSPVKGRHNKIAYRARENDEKLAEINPNYLDLHSPAFGVGTKIILKAINNKDIGIYNGDSLIGYMHLPKGDELELIKVRDYVFKNGPITTEVTDKTVGNLNIRKDKSRVDTGDAIPSLKALAIGRDNKLAISVDGHYNGSLLINEPANIQNGITYAIVDTPNGKQIALPLDTKKMNEEVVNSVMMAFSTILHPDLLDENTNKLFDEIFEKFDIDLRTSAGFEKYFKTFFYNYKLNDPIDIAEKNADKSDKRFVEFVGNGIRYLKSGGAILRDGSYYAKELTVNTPNESKEALMQDLHSHLSKMYFNVDLESLATNKPINLPILYIDSDENIKYKEYYKPSYYDHIKSITETNIVGVPLKNNEYSYFIQPTLYFSTAFLGKEVENNYGMKQTQPEEKKGILEATEGETKTPKRKGFRSIVSQTPVVKDDTNVVTDKMVEERKDICK